MKLAQGFLPAWTLAVCVGVYGSAGLAQAPASIREDPLYGTWVLEREKSVFVDSEPLREQIRIIEPHVEGVKAKVVTIDHLERATVTEYVAAYDGVEHPFSGAQSADAVILTRETPYVGVTTFRHAGIPIGEARREITRDGKKMTVTVIIRGNVQRITVFRKAN